MTIAQIGRYVILNNKKTIEFVLENLSAANFDPEFFKHFEKEIVKIYEVGFLTSKMKRLVK